jgi:hypothetical protein
MKLIEFCEMKKRENNMTLFEHLDEILSLDDHILVLTFLDLKIYFHDFDENEDQIPITHNDLI